jgi:hypothetical protein
MRRLARRFGIAFVVCDLVVGVASAAVLHHGTSAAASGGRMSAAQLEQIVDQSITAAHADSSWPLKVETSCSVDPVGGWDYYCISSDGSRTLYDVSAGGITQRSDLQSYR